MTRTQISIDSDLWIHIKKFLEDEGFTHRRSGMIVEPFRDLWYLYDELNTGVYDRLDKLEDKMEDLMLR